MKSLKAGDRDTDGLRGGRTLRIVVVNGRAIVERSVAGAVVEKLTITADTVFGPYLDYMTFRVICLSGSVRVEQVAAATPPPATLFKRNYTVILWHFPGWNPAEGGGPHPTNVWGVIPPNRHPLIGPYDESKQEPCDWLLTVCRDHGIDVLNLEVYWSDDGTGQNRLKPFLHHFLERYVESTVPNKPKFMLTFICDTNREHFNLANWPQIYNFAFKHFRDPNYFKVDGKPAMGILGMPSWQIIMGNTAAGAAAALNQARNAAQEEFGGIYFVGVHSDSSNYWMTNAVTHGWDAMTCYTLFSKTENNADSVATTKTGFDRLDDACFGDEEVINGKTYHSWMGNAGYSVPGQFPAPTLLQHGWPSSGVPHVWTPLMAGWNSKPWDETNTVEAIPANDAAFEAHCIRARNSCDANRAKTRGFISITAATEYGEGQYIVPTADKGFGPMQTIKRVFGA